jgi:hypothetical protein
MSPVARSAARDIGSVFVNSIAPETDPHEHARYIPIALSLARRGSVQQPFYPPCGKKPLVINPQPLYTCRTRDKTLFVGQEMKA